MSFYGSCIDFYDHENNSHYILFDEIVENGLLQNDTIFIPRSINIGFENFIIKRISIYIQNSFIKSIVLVDDSEITSIEDLELKFIENISIPSSLKEFKFNNSIKHLKKITISPLNKNFMFIDDQYLLGKTNIDQDNFDVLLFARRDIIEAIIPPYIKVIGPRSFDCCSNLNSIKFTKDSQLESIEEYAFSKCLSLQNISFPDSLKYIKKYAFSSTIIEEIKIPPNLEKIDEEGFEEMKKLKNILVSSSNKKFEFICNKFLVYKQEFDSIIFSMPDIEEAKIPSNIKIISQCAFQNRIQLKTVSFNENSILTSIEKEAFCGCTSLNNILIPNSLKYIHEKAFYNCNSLTSFIINDDSELINIGSLAFGLTNIEYLNIPSKFEKFDERSLSEMDNLQGITISPLNKRFIKIDNMFLLSKSEIENEEYDSLILSDKNIDEIEIPAEVKHISAFAFEKCLNLRKIKFNDSNLITVGKDAFIECISLEKLIFPSSISSFSSFQFSNFNECSLLEHITFPPSIEEIVDYAFYKSHKLKTVIFLESSQLKSINKYAFEYCTSLEQIKIPSSVQFIKEYAFSYCNNLKIVEILDDSALTCIGENAFNPTSIDKIYIPSNVEEIGLLAFRNVNSVKNITLSPCNKNFEIVDEKYFIQKKSKKDEMCNILIKADADIEEAIIPSYIKRIESYAFNSCFKLKKIIIPENSSLQSIGKFSFNKTLIEEIYIPSKIKTIELGSFLETKIKNIIISDENKVFKYIDNKLLINTINNSTIFARIDIEDVMIPSYIKKIDNFTFYDCQSLKNISFPDNSQIISFGVEAFRNCSSLVNIEIPSSLKIIDSYCFYSCSALKAISFDNNSQLTIIDSKAFKKCYSIKSISIPNSVQYINFGAFKRCYSLENIEISNQSKLQKIDFSVIASTNIKNFTIPSNVQCFNGYWLEDCSNFKKLFISPDNKNFLYIDKSFYVGKTFCHDDIKSIIFANRDIVEISIPSYIESIMPYSFNHCENLKKIIFSEDSNIKRIEENAFSYCSSLEQIIIPSSIEYIDGKAFYHCKNLKSVIFSKESKITFLGKESFAMCESLETIEIPSGIKSIEERTFYNCKSLKSISFSKDSKL